MKTKNINLRKLKMILAILFVLTAAFSYGGRRLLTDRPFAVSREFDGPSGVFAGSSGRVYVVDAGKKSVLILNRNLELEYTIDASDNGFYYASLVAEGSDGSIYISDAKYSGRGTELGAERIFRYDINGANPRLIYSFDYTESADPPMQYGRIKSMTEIDGSLVFSMLGEDFEGIEINIWDVKTNTLQPASRFELPGIYIADADVIAETLMPVFATKIGQIGFFDENGATLILTGYEGRNPWYVKSDGGSIYYADLSSSQIIRSQIIRMSTSGEELEAEVVIESADPLYSVFVMDDRIFATDYMGIYVASETTGEIVYLDSPALANGTMRTVVWITLFVSVALVFALALIILIPVFKRKKSATFQRMMIVIVSSISVGTLASYITLNQMVSSRHDAIMDQLDLFCDTLINATDIETLQNITRISDYMEDDYKLVKSALDRLTNLTYENEVFYYYIVYMSDGETIYGVMDYEETMTARQPFYHFGEEIYTDPFLGESVQIRADVSSYGNWSFALKPIYGEDGVVAVMEVGVNLDDFSAQNRALVINIILTVAAATVVLLMLIIETIFYFEHLETLRGDLTEPRLARAGGYPLRTLIFITFLADCMQDAFISIYANQLYQPMLGIPQGIGAALPLSGQVLAAALFAVMGGSLIKALGTRRTLIGGFGIQLVGFVICAAMGDYLGLLAGKLLIGSGMGLIIVSINSLSAVEPTEDARAAAFTAVSAGTLAGVTAGSGMGSVILSLGNFSTVFIVGAGILLIGLFMTLTASGAAVAEPELPAEEKVSIFKFLADRQVITFLTLILTPFLIALSFREYFFPIYAADNGVSEADIGRVYLLCGLVVIYAGPYLTETLINKLGVKWTVVISSALMCSATLLFAVSPTLAAAVTGLVLLSVATSFGYAAQSTYYSTRPSVARYGESRAMGLYSLFDNSGQALGPVVYGLSVFGGYRMGLLIIGVVITLLMVLFVTVNAKDKDA